VDERGIVGSIDSQHGPSATRRRITAPAVLAATLAVLVGAPALPVRAHGEAVDVRVESLVFEESDGLMVRYAVSLSFADGDPYDSAAVTTDTGDTFTQVEDGLYVGDVTGEEPHAVTISFQGDLASGTVEITDDDLRGDMGLGPVVRVDTSDPGVEGSPAGSETLFSAATRPTPATTVTTTTVPAPTATTATSATTATTASPVTTTHTDHGSHEVEPATAGVETARVDVPTAGGELGRQLALRLAHVAAVATWVGALVASLAGKGSRPVSVAAWVGMTATVATGVLLARSGTPIPEPGLFDWSGWAAHPYGTAYRTVFAVKMSLVVLAGGGTWWAVRRRSRGGGWLALMAAGGAVVAVTVLTQLHLLVHS
jgi:hypothetical protein